MYCSFYWGVFSKYSKVHCLITASLWLTELQFLFVKGSSLCGLGKEAGEILQKNSNNILHHSKYVYQQNFPPMCGTITSLLHHCHPTYYVRTALQAFRDQYGTNPSRSHDNTDSNKLLQLKQEVATKCNVSSDLIPEDFTNCCYSELSPVCAIIGGVLGQEIIKVSFLIPHSLFW